MKKNKPYRQNRSVETGRIIGLVLVLLFVWIAGMGCVTSAQKMVEQKVLVEADNENIGYMGRVDFSNPKEPRFDWPGVSIRAAFEGGYCGIGLSDGGNDYNVFIDGKLREVISTKRNTELYDAASGLDSGTHTLLVTKRTESSFGICTFKGLYLEKGKRLLPLQRKSARFIEFIGDSISCGYGNESTHLICPSLREFENNYLSYCGYTARSLDADYSVIAISGRGIVRNYGEKARTSANPMPSYYDRVLANDSTKTWDYSRRQADIVVINLGTNDYSTQPKPDEDVFVSEYLKLVSRVRQNYPLAEIFCLCGTMATYPQCSVIRKAVDSATGDGENKIHFVGTPSFPQEDCGCDWHPNVASHKLIADALLAEIGKYVK
jgi:lysophospholipase L1-like esterase